jgi:hypothetical protein
LSAASVWITFSTSLVARPGAEGQRAPERAHHAGRHRTGEPERVADRDDQLAHPELRRVTQLGLVEVASIESKDGQVRELVSTDDLEPLLVSVDEDRRSTRGPGDDVGRGDGEPIGGDHDPRARTLDDASSAGTLDDAQARNGGG